MQPRTELASAPDSRSSRRCRSDALEFHIRFIVIARHGHRVGLAPAQLVEASVAHDAREPGLRLRLRRAVASGVMPDVDERLLQEVLGRCRFPQDTQCNAIQMRRGEPVELRERRLIGERRAGEELGKPGAAIGIGCRHGGDVRRALARLRAILPPEHVGPAAGAVQRSREDEQEVREAIEIAARRIADRHRSPPCGRARARRAGRRCGATCASAAARVPPGRMNSLSAPRSALNALDGILETRDVGVGDCGVPGNRQLAAQVEEIVLDAREAVDDGVRQRFGEQETQRRVELVDIADRVDPRRILRHARAVAQARRAGVARARDDFREAVAHGRAPGGGGAAYEKRR